MSEQIAIIHREQRLTISHVELLTGKKKSSIYREIKAGTFPEPERDGPRCSRWRAGDVLDHLQRRAQKVAA